MDQVGEGNMKAGSSPPRFDLYRELEVDVDASLETIEAAWRSLVKRYHPDANPGLGNERIRRLNDAHDWLIDPVRRARYDSMRRRSAETQRPVKKAASPRPIAAETKLATAIGTRASSLTWLGYMAACLASVVAAYVIAVIFGVLLGAANVTAIAAALIGEEGALSLLQLLGNLVFAGVLGVSVVASFSSAFHGPSDDGTLVVVGGVTALAVTFGFPAFAQSYLTGLAEWMATDGAGLPAIAAISVIEAAVVGLVVAGTGSMRRPR
jgi:hypothetical protein